VRYLRPHRKDPKQAEDILARDVLSQQSGRDARTITPAEVLELLNRIVDRVAPVQANRTAALLNSLAQFLCPLPSFASDMAGGRPTVRRTHSPFQV
jgi:hypothetical protein